MSELCRKLLDQRAHCFLHTVDSYLRFKFSHYKVKRNQNIAAFTAQKQQCGKIMDT